MVAFAATVAGCTGAVVFADRLAQVTPTGVLRIATERGLRDASNSGSLVIDIPIEVRTQSVSAQLPGCAIRAVRLPVGTHPDSLLTSLQEDPDVQLQMVAASDAIVPPDQTRIATLRLTAPPPLQQTRRGPRARAPAPVLSLWLRFDETVLDQTVNCPAVQSTGPGLQLYRLERVDVEPGGLGVMAGAGILIAILVLAAR